MTEKQMPAQKRGKSRQDYQTPPDFIKAVKLLLQIDEFGIDLAASKENTVARRYYSEVDDALHAFNGWRATDGLWAWCNPPFNNIRPWVQKASVESLAGAYIAMLVPASVGANWWRDYVDREAYALLLNERLTFVGETDPYPKDCALLLYTPMRLTGYRMWRWSEVLENGKDV